MCFRLVAVDDYSGGRCKGTSDNRKGGKRGGYSDVATWFVDRLPLHPDTTQISDPHCTHVKCGSTVLKIEGTIPSLDVNACHDEIIYVSVQIIIKMALHSTPTK
nr:PREDICTED: uncharacterized protein LOC105662829 [Megachile rotundata]